MAKRGEQHVNKIIQNAEVAAHARQLAKFERRVSELEATRRNLLKELEVSESRVGILQSLREGAPAELYAPSGNPHAQEASIVLLCSDWHVGETVRPETAQNRNRYDRKIAAKRIDGLIDGFLWHLETLRTREGYGWNINNVVVWLGGDIITGYIHEELMESNSMSPTEEVLFASQLVRRLLDAVASHPGIESVHVPCSYGNHGRTTPKKRISTSAKNSFEWLMYQVLAEQYANHPKIKFTIAGGEVMLCRVYQHTLRFTHGDLWGLRYGGGVGGITIPIKKYVMRENENESAAVTCFGHFHQFVDEQRFVVNNCLIGYGALSQSLGAPFSPPSQVMFLMDRKRGKKFATEIFL